MNQTPDRPQRRSPHPLLRPAAGAALLLAGVLPLAPRLTARLTLWSAGPAGHLCEAALTLAGLVLTGLAVRRRRSAPGGAA